MTKPRSVFRGFVNLSRLGGGAGAPYFRGASQHLGPKW
jgi:hypothetical protein